MTTRAQKAATQAYFANERLVPARITTAVARRFGVETVAEAWVHLHEIMIMEQAEAQQRQADSIISQVGSACFCIFCTCKS